MQVYDWQVGNLPMVGDNLPMLHKRHPAISKITYDKWQLAKTGFSILFLVAGFLRAYTPNDNLVRPKTENPRICRFKAYVVLRPWKAHVNEAVVSA